ncbi:protein arginine N-methyltransferase 5-like isoform X2 [Penaeus japonicus]|uniref:protein arginine N-methyltransferase 5-like isoform X2 n=1 Tax=Penaeus japonicus TaxID=27405 RepID=UPI001C71248C|nr:protein arginine N-methyltransferase 5-like isoform X2 [Penaeus japonicus]
MAGSRVSCGLECSNIYELNDSLQESSKAGYDFLSIPLAHPRFTREHVDGKAKNRAGAFTRSDLLLSSSEWNSLIVGRLSPCPILNLESSNNSLRQNSENTVTQELTFAAHLGLPAIMFTLTTDRCCNIARLVHNRVVQGVCYQVWVRVPMQAPEELAAQYRSDKSPSEDGFGVDTWTWWNRFHSIANVEKKIGLALEVSADLPEQSVIDRWLGEPIRCAILPTSIWLTNKKGFPVLSRAHQQLVRGLFKLHVQFVVSGPLRHQHFKLYQQYLEHIIRVNQEMDPLMDFARGYEDYLQCPLQPLMDNLESQTYEVFEKDPVKYSEYERAMYLAICDKIPEEEKETKEIVLMVVGAGRGPLVRRALAAAKAGHRKIKIYAVEKNPNAVVTLQAQQDEDWGDQVTVVSCDMRDWDAPEKADILVSELLGSFGDNELSPECLDGAQKFMKEDGISIPCNYTSYLSPLQSPKLYNEIRNCREKDKHFLAHFETPYVVFLHNKKELAPSQALFTFSHPNKDKVIDNTRYKALQFQITEDNVVHGFGGYFEATLYKDVFLSIKPETHSRGMFSWFPILFPLKEPVPVRIGELLEVHFWRCTNRKNVWYEWCVTGPLVGSIHNPNGRAYTIGL